MWEQLATGFALMLVFEGIMPFIYPQHWRKMMQSMLGQNDRFLRIAGLSSMLLGVLVMYIAHGF